jgi:hypothetical protein
VTQLYEIEKQKLEPAACEGTVKMTFSELIQKIRAKKGYAPKPRADMGWEDVVIRWPMLTAHMICHSLGYATAGKAARIILDAVQGRQNWCEWIASCYKCDPKPALEHAIQGRKSHTGYMAEIENAKKLVLQDLLFGEDPSQLAGWF